MYRIYQVITIDIYKKKSAVQISRVPSTEVHILDLSLYLAIN